MNVIKKIKWHLRQYHRMYYNRWVMPDYEEKREIILSYKNRCGSKTFIETGTFLGDTIERLSSSFNRLVSFELSEDLATRAVIRFGGAAGHLAVSLPITVRQSSETVGLSSIS